MRQRLYQQSGRFGEIFHLEFDADVPVDVILKDQSRGYVLLNYAAYD
jgi:hypothetical protein